MPGGLVIAVIKQGQINNARLSAGCRPVAGSQIAAECNRAVESPAAPCIARNRWRQTAQTGQRPGLGIQCHLPLPIVQRSPPLQIRSISLTGHELRLPVKGHVLRRTLPGQVAGKADTIGNLAQPGRQGIGMHIIPAQFALHRSPSGQRHTGGLDAASGQLRR